MDVRLPDGTIIRNVPEGTTKQQLVEKLGRLQGQAAPSDGPGAMESFARGGVQSFMNNAISALDLVPDLMGQNLRRPDATEFMGVGEAVTQIPGAVAAGEPVNFPQRVEQATAAQQASAQQAAEQNPVATALGETAGDAATLLTGRLPFARGLRAPQQAVSAATKLSPSARRFVQRAIESKGFKALARGAGRSVETGLEGAALAILKDSDPVETAALAAGGQAGGSLALSALQGLFSGGPLKIGAKVALAGASAGALIQLAKTVTPGGKDFSLESLETGFGKVAFGIATGVLAGMAGAGRLRTGAFAEDLPKIAEAITTIPRGAMLSFITEFSKSDSATQQDIDRIYTKLSSDPDFFGRQAGKRLTDAFRSEKKSVTGEIEKLMKDKGFRQKLDAISER